MRTVHFRQFNRLLVVTLGGLIALAVGASLVVRWARGPEFDASDATLAIKLAPDEQLPALLPTLVSLEERPQVDFLAGLLRDERPAVRQAARETLAARFERWSTLPPTKSQDLVAALAKKIAAIAVKLPEDSRPFAAELTTRIMLWPVELDTRLDEQIVADCQKALRDIGPIVESGDGGSGAPRGSQPAPSVVPTGPRPKFEPE